MLQQHATYIHSVQKCYNAHVHLVETLTCPALPDRDCLLISPIAQCSLLLLMMQAFVQKLAVCLLDVDRNPDSPMFEQLINWTAEATCFVSL